MPCSSLHPFIVISTAQLFIIINANAHQLPNSATSQKQDEMLPVNGNKSNSIPQELLDDISSRFLLDAPDSDLKDPISLCFLTELAYWFYLDEYVEENDALSNLKFDSFALQLLQHVKIEPLKGSLEEMLQDFRDFKHRVPTYGALILSTDLSNVLLVQGFWHRASWGFPKGKINVKEEPYKCAIREVLEETGYDIGSKINKDVFLENTIGEQKVRLYIIPDVPLDTEFVPRTKGEIKELKWFPISQLPSHKNDRNYPKNTGTTNMFYMVMPFVKPLREWVAVKSRCGSVPNDKSGSSKKSRRRHCSLNSNVDSYQRGLHNSPCPPPVSSSSADVSKGKGHHSVIQSSFVDGNYERLRPSTDASPRKRETKAKSKGKNGNFSVSENIVSDDHSQTKFTFKSRGKSKGGHPGSNNNAQVSCNVSQNNRTNSNSIYLGSGATCFRSYSWQNFRINKRAINEALDKAWNGVTIEIK